jgi:hypothetical protein
MTCDYNGITHESNTMIKNATIISVDKKTGDWDKQTLLQSSRGRTLEGFKTLVI